MKEYLVDAAIDYELYKNKYNDLIFMPISSRTFMLRVPDTPEAEAELTALQKEIKSIYIPSLYGLNVNDSLAESNISFFHNYPYGELRGTGVLIGIIDTGIDYTNTLFQYEDQTTRIVSIWDQSIDGKGVKNFSYGTEYTEETINKALQSPDPYSIVPSKDEIGHGTFLAGVAAGNDRSGEGQYVGAAPDALLAIVKLKPADKALRDLYLIQDTAVAYQDNDYLAGVAYLIQLAKLLGKPIAICTGLGTNEGAHDGTTATERYLNEVSSYENVIMVLSAGNEANQGHHYMGNIKQGSTDTFEFNVQEKEKGVFINIYAAKPDILAISLKTPLGRSVSKIPAKSINPAPFKVPLEPTEITVWYGDFNLNSGNARISIRMADPTPGVWQITVYGESIVSGEYNVWMPREGFILPNTRFLKPEVYTTVCIPATSEPIIVVGAYNDVDKSVYAASGRGPTTNNVIRPDFVAPGVNVLGPNLNDGYTRATGTSIAAAITTGASALLLEWTVVKGNFTGINTRVAKTIFVRAANRSPMDIYPNNITGYGQLNLKNSILGI